MSLADSRAMLDALGRKIAGIFARDQVLIFPECTPWWLFYRILLGFLLLLLAGSYAGLIPDGLFRAFAGPGIAVLLAVVVIDRHNHGKPQ